MPSGHPPGYVVGQRVSVRAFSPTSTTSTVKKAFADAIAIGAPAYNNGVHDGCYAIYRATCEEIVARVSSEPTRQVLQQALDVAARQALGDPTSAAWTMRRTMDQLMTPGSRSLARGIVEAGVNERIENMPEAQVLWESRQSLVRAATRTAVPTELFSAPAPPVARPTAVRAGRDAGRTKKSIKDAIAIGAPAYNHGNTAGCYYLYRRTGEEIVARLEGGGGGGSAAARALQGLLKSALLQAALESEAGGARRAAWTVRRAFDELLRQREE